MVDKLNELSESEKEKSPDHKNKENPFRFEQQELASLRLSIEEKRDKDLEKSGQVYEKKKPLIQNNVHQKSLDIVWLPPINQEGLQKRKESAQSVVTMVQDAKNDTGIVGVLWSWADRILHGVDV